MKAPFLGEGRYRMPGALYNGKVAPIQPMALRGVIWYQGEGNTGPPLNAVYARMLETMIQRWREDFRQPELPFLIVQLPRYKADGWPLLREAQANVADRLHHTALAVTIDSGSESDIHPRDKHIVGECLALLARARVYGESLAGDAPRFVTATRAGTGLILQFNNVGEGLKNRDGKLELKLVPPDLLVARRGLAGMKLLHFGNGKVNSPEHAHLHDSYHPQPGGQGEGKSNSGVLVNWQEKIAGTERTVVHSIALHGYGPVAGWHGKNLNGTIALESPGATECWSVRSEEGARFLDISESASGRRWRVDGDRLSRVNQEEREAFPLPAMASGNKRFDPAKTTG